MEAQPAIRHLSIWAQLISLVEAPLLLFLVAMYIEGAGPSSVSSFSDPYVAYDTPPAYVPAFLYIASLAAVICCGLIVAAFLRGTARRWSRLRTANLITAVTVGIGVAGDVLLSAVWHWTRPAVDTGYGASYVDTPTANGIFEGIALALAAGALTAVIPVLVLFLLNRHAEQVPAPPA